MSTQTPVDAPPHILRLLSELHQKSLQQEAALSEKGKVFSSDVMGDLEDKRKEGDPADEFDRLMRDKFIALDEDKCQFMYQLINAMGATNVVEAGTSFGVSTIYLALAVARTKAATGKPGVVIATEKEQEKAQVARKYWAHCGAVVEQEVELREGDLLETLKVGLPTIDLLLLDSECDRLGLSTLLTHKQSGLRSLFQRSKLSYLIFDRALLYSRITPSRGRMGTRTCWIIFETLRMASEI